MGFAAVSQVWGIFKAWRWRPKFCHADVNRSGFTCGRGGSTLSRWAILQAISWSNWTRKVPWAGGVCASLQRYFCYGLLQFGRHRHTSKIQHAGSTHDNPGWTKKIQQDKKTTQHYLSNLGLHSRWRSAGRGNVISLFKSVTREFGPAHGSPRLYASVHVVRPHAIRIQYDEPNADNARCDKCSRVADRTSAAFATRTNVRRERDAQRRAAVER